MTKDQIILRVEAWVAVVKKYNNLSDQVEKVFRGWIDSPIAEATEEIIQEFQASLSNETGIQRDALDWFRFDNEFGVSAKECRFNGEVYTINSVESFVEYELLTS